MVAKQASDEWIALADGAGIVKRGPGQDNEPMRAGPGPDIPASSPAESPQQTPVESPSGSPEEHPDSRPNEAPTETPTELPPQHDSVER